MEYTPGKWEVRPINDLEDPDTAYAICRPKLDSEPEPIEDPWLNIAFINERGFGNFNEVEANARLIASAPDLYEACKEIIEIDDKSTNIYTNSQSRTVLACAIETGLWQAAVQGAKLALAKAESPNA